MLNFEDAKHAQTIQITTIRRCHYMINANLISSLVGSFSTLVRLDAGIIRCRHFSGLSGGVQDVENFLQRKCIGLRPLAVDGEHMMIGNPVRVSQSDRFRDSTWRNLESPRYWIAGYYAKCVRVFILHRSWSNRQPEENVQQQNLIGLSRPG